jgi:methionyl-tRNA formyltransferase
MATNQKIKYVFFGTPRFAEIVLTGLIDAGMEPTAVVCNPDRPFGRKHILTPPPTKMLAIKTSPDIDILQPEKIDEVFIKRLRALEPDFFVVAAYAKIIPASVLAIPKFGTLGVHPSLLPQYRGASPIQSVILAGEATTGVTIYLMDEQMDHGPICGEQKILSFDPLSTTYPVLEEKLATLAIDLIPLAMAARMDPGVPAPDPQDETRVTFTQKFKTENGFIEYSELDAAIAGNSDKAELILRTINALNPEPGVWTIKDGKRIKLLEARMDGNALKLVTIQEDGQKPKATQ